MSIDFWTDERVDQLKTLSATGISYREIGAKIGCTRNAAIGKALRLGMSQAKLPRPPKQTVQRKPIVRIVRMNGNSDKMRVMQSVTGVPYMVRCTKVEPLHISFDQLTSTTCHYPHGNEISAMTFCGRLTMAGSSYCLDCHRICYRKPEPPKPAYVREAA
jgi:hypothetical protein